jgi:hypothetical protein
MGIVPVAALNDPQRMQQFVQRQLAALAGVQQRLLASANERDRVAGLVLQAALLPRDDMDRATDAANQDCDVPLNGQQNHVKSPACVAAEIEQQRVVAQREQRELSIAQQLVAMAQSTSDSAVYSQAVRLCSSFVHQPSPPACSSISLAQWSRLDPENMVPWLWALDHAQRQKDGNGAAEALYRVSQSNNVDARFDLVAQQIFGATDEANEVEQTAAMTLAVGIVAARNVAPFGSLAASCSAKEVANANRRQVCEDVANRLVAQSDTLLGRLEGIRVGKQLGWASERTDSLSNETLALGLVLWAAPKDSGSDEQNFLGCAAVRKTRRKLRSIHELGELGAARQNVLDSGRSVQQVTQEYVQRQQAQATASAPQR